jgi:hypothetical protein
VYFWDNKCISGYYETEKSDHIRCVLLMLKKKTAFWKAEKNKASHLDKSDPPEMRSSHSCSNSLLGHCPGVIYDSAAIWPAKNAITQLSSARTLTKTEKKSANKSQNLGKNITYRQSSKVR